MNKHSRNIAAAIALEFGAALLYGGCDQRQDAPQTSALGEAVLPAAVAPAIAQPSPVRERIDAAERLTRIYSKSRYSGWNLKAEAGGADCRILIVRASIVLDISMAEAMHYGSGAYDVYAGGVQQFARNHSFRGVVYTDPTERAFPFETATQQEIENLTACH
jgi:hypothetical protein